MGTSNTPSSTITLFTRPLLSSTFSSIVLNESSLMKAGEEILGRRSRERTSAFETNKQQLFKIPFEDRFPHLVFSSSILS